MQSFIEAVLAFVTVHADWAGPLLFLVCFGESLVLVSAILPGTAVLIAAGALVPSGVLAPLPLVLWSIAGAVLGDAVSYRVGALLGPRAHLVWPFARHPALLGRGIAHFERHGGKSVFIGRFFGPLRAIVPLAAGIMGMKPRPFWFANIASAALWAPAMLLPGAMLAEGVEKTANGDPLLSLAALVLIGLVWAALRRA
jgi:membrane protein DedA with SNARE-associated domain